MVTKNKKVKKTNPRKDLYPIFFLIILSIFLLLIIVSDIKIRSKRAEMSKEIERLEEEVKALENRTSDLQLGISEADKDAYWEERARDQGLVKEGEKPVVVIPPDGSDEDSGEINEDLGFWSNIIEKVKRFLRE